MGPVSLEETFRAAQVSIGSPGLTHMFVCLELLWIAVGLLRTIRKLANVEEENADVVLVSMNS